MLRLESLSLAMWYSVEKNFGPTSACDSARKERVAQLEQKFRKLASCLHLPPEEAWLQFTHIKDLVLNECACVCVCVVGGPTFRFQHGTYDTPFAVLY